MAEIISPRFAKRAKRVVCMGFLSNLSLTAMSLVITNSSPLSQWNHLSMQLNNKKYPAMQEKYTQRWWSMLRKLNFRSTEMKPLGTTRLKVTKYSIEFVAVPDDLTPLLGARTAQQKMELITVREGVRRSIIPWICSFLTDRWQCVKLVQTVSNWLACLLACLLTYLLTYMGTSSSGPVWAKQERVHDHSRLLQQFLGHWPPHKYHLISCSFEAEEPFCSLWLP